MLNFKFKAQAQDLSSRLQLKAPNCIESRFRNTLALMSLATVQKVHRKPYEKQYSPIWNLRSCFRNGCACFF